MDESLKNLTSEYLIDARNRGFIYQASDISALDKILAQTKCIAYIGFDATADCLHVGNLIQIMRLKRLQYFGHKPIVLIGGGTTKVGDPSGKNAMRSMMDEERIAININGIKRVLEKYILFGDGPTDALLVNNSLWLNELKHLDFLRAYGKYFSINRMLGFDIIKGRINNNLNLSLLEFSYIMLQAYDFTELHKRYGCILQMGGADQWSNIISGIELTKRTSNTTVYGLTCTLLTTASGDKMGKTADGAVWLQDDKLPIFDFWQYWRNTHDLDVIKFLKLFTEVDLKEIARYAQLQGADLNAAKDILATEVTALCYDRPAAEQAMAAAHGNSQNNALSDGLPVVIYKITDETILLIDLLLSAHLCSSRADAKRNINAGAVRMNGKKITDITSSIAKDTLLLGDTVLSIGKKRSVIIAGKRGNSKAK